MKRGEMSGEEPTDEQRDEAALWLAKRTGGSLQSGDAEKLEDWLNADRRHRRAFDELRVLYAQLEEPAQRMAAKSPLRGKFAARFQPGWNWLMPPLAAAAIVCSIWWIDPGMVQNWRADIVTGQQVVSDITLPDGSVARLGADTALTLDFDDGKRRIGLLRGEAYFEVRHGQPGIFTVTAAGDEVRDIGTKFNVDLQDDQTEVAVLEGAVEVIGANDASSVIVREGNQVAIAGGRARNVEPTDTELALSWLTGRLVVQGVTVAEVVHSLQRHATTRIMVRGSLARRKISGTFPLTDVDASLSTIVSAVGGSMTKVTPFVTVLY